MPGRGLGDRVVVHAARVEGTTIDKTAQAAGELVVDDGRITAARPGQALRGPGYRVAK